METIVLVASSAVGALTAMAIDKVSHNVNKLHKNNTHSINLQKILVSKAVERVYEYEREGRITVTEREKLIIKYRQEQNKLDNDMGGVALYDHKVLNSLKENLVLVVDQRMAEITSKLDDLAGKIDEAPVKRKTSTPMDRDNGKLMETPKHFTPIEITENITSTENTKITENTNSIESPETDASLEEIKKQITQTLSRLEQAEVE